MDGGTVNRVVLVGHVTADATVADTPSGHPVATFAVRTVEVWTDRERRSQERAIDHPVRLVGKIARALVPYLTTGRRVYVEGKLQLPEAGDVERSYIVRSDRVVLLDL